MQSVTIQDPPLTSVISRQQKQRIGEMLRIGASRTLSYDCISKARQGFYFDFHLFSILYYICICKEF